MTRCRFAGHRLRLHGGWHAGVAGRRALRVCRRLCPGGVIACASGLPRLLPCLRHSQSVELVHQPLPLRWPKTRNMRIATEEIFGPVVTVTAFSSENEAVEIANGSDYGLLAGVYSRDSTTAFRVARRLLTGGAAPYVRLWHQHPAGQRQQSVAHRPGQQPVRLLQLGDHRRPRVGRIHRGIRKRVAVGRLSSSPCGTARRDRARVQGAHRPSHPICEYRRPASTASIAWRV
ncbi:aldehyde dehydrogenase family protein [Streptomyces sp. NPDC086549]|uniref:aldehyde dehydrogenase family protein n=1 Tax=Streptomyces sp. NPDC086549 TaxID=3365752 RepID=UPI003805A0B6